MRAQRRPMTVLSLLMLVLATFATPAVAIFDPTRRIVEVPGDAFDVVQGTISPDGSWIVFVVRIELGPDVHHQVHAMPVADDVTAADDATQLTPLLLERPLLRVTADSRYVVLSGDFDDTGARHVHSVPIDGTADDLIRLSEREDGAGDVWSWSLAPDGGRVAYVGDTETAGAESLFTVPVDGSQSPVRVHAAPLAPHGVSTHGFTPDSSRVVFEGDLQEAGRQDLYSAPADGSSPAIRVSDVPVAHGDVRGIPSHGFSEDGRQIVFRGDLEVDGRWDLYRADLDRAGTQERISGAFEHGDGGNTRSGMVDWERGRVVYISQAHTPGAYDLYVATLDGGEPPRRLSAHGPGYDAVVPDDPGDEPRLTPDGDEILWLTRADGRLHLFRAPLDGSEPPHEYEAGLLAPSQIRSFWTTPGGELVYVVTSGHPGGTDIRITDLDGDGTPRSVLDSPLFEGSPETSWHVTLVPDGSRMILQGDLETTDVAELVSVPFADSAAPVRLHPPASGPDGDVRVGLVAPDSSFVLFRAALDTEGRDELYASGVGQQPPPAPMDLGVGQLGDRTASVSWSAVPATSQVSGYQVTVTTAEPSTRQAAASAADTPTTVTGTSIDLTGLSPGTTYDVAVRSINDAGVGTPATVTFTTTGDAPGGETGVVRRAGDDRFATAALASAAAFPDGADVVYVATGSDFPDALAGAPLAARDGAPILLTRRDAVPDPTLAELERLDPSSVVVLGGPAAVSDAVAAELGAVAPVDRVFGSNRYETAVEISEPFPTGGTVYLATGVNFPDALAGAAAAGRDDGPILLTTKDRVPEATMAALRDLQPSQVIALGGAGVITEAVLDQVRTEAGAPVARLAGEDRFVTSAAVAATFGEAGTVYIATGGAFPDALAAGPIAGAEPAPILLTRRDVLPNSVVEQIERLRPRRIVVLGGDGAVATALDGQLAELLGD